MVEILRPVSVTEEDRLRKATRKLSPGQADHVRTVVYDGMVRDCHGVEGFLKSLEGRPKRQRGNKRPNKLIGYP